MIKRVLVAIGLIIFALSFTHSLDAAEKGKGKGKKEKKGIKEMSQKELVKLALSAAPVHISKDATVMVPGADGKMVEAKKGTNGFTCIPMSMECRCPTPFVTMSNPVNGSMI